jgi:hypothetical protein
MGKEKAKPRRVFKSGNFFSEPAGFLQKRK